MKTPLVFVGINKLLEPVNRFTRFVNSLPFPLQYLIGAPILWFLVVKKSTLADWLMSGLFLLWLMCITLPSFLVYLVLQPVWRRVIPKV
jgi:hypothetical protein